MTEDERTYGFTGERSRWIRWEFAVVIAYWVGAIGFPSWFDFRRNPYGYSVSVLDAIAPSAAAAIVILWLIWMSGDSFEMFGIRRPQKSDYAWLAGLAVIEFLEKSLLRYRLFAHLQESRLFPKGYLDMLAALNPAQTLINFVVYLIPAAAEELFYRGIIQTRAQEIANNAWVAIGTSAALFSISHIYQGPQNLPYHLWFGLLFSFARWKGCSLWPLILVHAFYNSLTFSLL